MNQDFRDFLFYCLKGLDKGDLKLKQDFLFFLLNYAENLKFLYFPLPPEAECEKVQGSQGLIYLFKKEKKY